MRIDVIGHRVPILTYHSLDDSRSVISTPRSAFAQHMQWLHARRYRVISLSTLVGYLRRGEALPERAAVITFDDGFLSTYTEALPVLARFGFAATVFLVAGYCGGRNDWPGQPEVVPRYPLLSWAQVRELDGCGIEIGGHTLSHPRLDRLGHAQIEREVLDSKAMIEDRIGHGIDLFAYPYGRWTGECREIVGRFHSGACTTRLALVGKQSDPLALCRVEGHYLSFRPVLEQLQHPLFPVYLSVRRALRAASAVALRREWE